MGHTYFKGRGENDALVWAPSTLDAGSCPGLRAEAVPYLLGVEGLRPVVERQLGLGPSAFCAFFDLFACLLKRILLYKDTFLILGFGVILRRHLTCVVYDLGWSSLRGGRWCLQHPLVSWRIWLLDEWNIWSFFILNSPPFFFGVWKWLHDKKLKKKYVGWSYESAFYSMDGLDWINDPLLFEMWFVKTASRGHC